MHLEASPAGTGPPGNPKQNRSGGRFESTSSPARPLGRGISARTPAASSGLSRYSTILSAVMAESLSSPLTTFFWAGYSKTRRRCWRTQSSLPSGWMVSGVYLQISDIHHSPRTFNALVLGEPHVLALGFSRNLCGICAGFAGTIIFR